ncbi:hypothetical protein [Streptomyces swartbergensis]|uniref:Uncharacterized protein n=1 Tax=Streptomyces swartbergensis TaxID=487165 RepID=A0A2C9ZMM8_9ACTN|nr:hypothetical protein [Streptomyces swartbergensis]OUC96033.1 hypothetical protein CA983_32455 [Streptomyces swartbergensis]
MRERPDGVGGTSEPETEGSKRIDLDMPQVAGGALAAVLAAELASYFGVYGTILGAGVVSVVAICGGTLFQHFFRRTGEQLRGATAVASRQAAGPTEQAPAESGEFTAGTVHRARARGWKRPVLAAAIVFGLTMTGITTYELVSGHNLSSGRSTTVGDFFTGDGKSSSDSGGSDGSGASSDSGSYGESGPYGDGDATTNSPSGTTPESELASPSPDEDGGTAPSPAPTPTPSAEGSEAPGNTTPSASPTPPEPSASSRSGTADQDRDGPATP